MTHVLLIQNSQDTLSTSLITGYEHIQGQEVPAFQLAFTTNTRFLLDHLILGLGIVDRCFRPGVSLQCQAWHGPVPIQFGWPLDLPGGSGIVLHMGFSPDDPGPTDGTSLLQVGSRRILKRTILQLEALVPAPKSQSEASCERTTTVSVAQEQWPQEESLSDFDGTSVLPTIAVCIIDGAGRQTLPNPLEVEAPGRPEQVQQELLRWGHPCRVYECLPASLLLCEPEHFDPGTGWHYVLYHDDPHDPHGLFLHSAPEEMTDIQLLRLLCALDYARAVILFKMRLCSHWIFVHFHHREPEAEVRRIEVRQKSDWPAPCSQTSRTRPLFVPAPLANPSIDCVLQTSFGLAETDELFRSGLDVLVTDFSVLDLSEDLREELAHFPIVPLKTIDQRNDFDRLLIFTDGSSIPAMRRHLPERADELGHPDTWSFVVVAETYNHSHPGSLSVLGWTTQPVRYTPGGAAYTGVTRTGSDMAERSSLISAAMWRLSLNHGISTVFCSDSAQGGGQAKGSLGTAQQDASYDLLRGLFQTLELALPGDRLQVHHVRAHTGDLFNEIADTAAKMEAKKSFNLPRQQLDMTLWMTHFSQLWTIYGHRCGLPLWTNGVLAVEPPDLPKRSRVPQLCEVPSLFLKQLNFFAVLAQQMCSPFFVDLKVMVAN